MTKAFQAHRVVSEGAAFGPVRGESAPWEAVGDWPCKWIAPAGELPASWIAAFRCQFTLSELLITRIHVTADERYELFLNDMKIGRGPERGMRQCWFYETYELTLPAGSYTLSARVLRAGPLRPWAQVSVAPGFLLCPDNSDAIRVMGTGVAPWQARLLNGCTMQSPSHDLETHFGGGPGFAFDATLWDWEDVNAQWESTISRHAGNNRFWLYAQEPVHWLEPATLPAMREDVISDIRVRHACDDDGLDYTAQVMALLSEHESWFLSPGVKICTAKGLFQLTFRMLFMCQQEVFIVWL